MPYFIPSVFNPSEFYDISIEDIIKKLRSEYKDLVFSIRQAKDGHQAKQLKKSLPAFTLGEFSGTVKPSALVSTKYLIYDVDGLKNDIEVMKLKEKVNRFSLFSFITPSNRGVKFVIAMDREITQETYEGNYKFYLEYFENILKVDIDKQYRSAQTFFSFDPKCEVNPETCIFKAYDLRVIRQAHDVDEHTVDNGEVTEAVTHLINMKKPLPYYEWISVGLALKTIPTGREEFLRFAVFDKTNGDTANKWETIGDPNKITIGTLFHIAGQYGYKRKKQGDTKNKGYKHPFLIKYDSGLGKKAWYLETEKGIILCFGFEHIQKEYIIDDPDDNNNAHAILNVDGQRVKLPHSSIPNANALRTALSGAAIEVHSKDASQCYTYLNTYLARTFTGKRLKECKGFGRVEPNLWNLGNSIVYNGDIFPFEDIFMISETRGMLLEKVPELNIQVRKEFLDKIGKLFHYYKDWAAIAIGWAYINIYFSEFRGNGFPILFIHGKTASGKTQLGHIIMALFGVVNPGSSNLKVNMAHSTSVGFMRTKNRANGIPNLLDEYGGKTETQQKEHFHVLKSLYDASGRLRGVKDNSDRTDLSQINSGTIITSCNTEVQQEAINRCVYICMDGVKSDEQSREWSIDFQGRAMPDLSAFILMCAVRANFAHYEKIYDQCYADLIESGADSRVVENYAKVYAGYKCFREIVSGKANLPDYDSLWWINLINDVTAMQKAERAIDKQIIEDIVKIVKESKDEVAWAWIEGTVLFLRAGKLDTLRNAIYNVNQSLRSVLPTGNRAFGQILYDSKYLIKRDYIVEKYRVRAKTHLFRIDNYTDEEPEPYKEPKYQQETAPF